MSLSGKVIGEVALLCHKHNKPFVTVVGQSTLSKVQLQELHIAQCHSVLSRALSTEDAMENVKSYLYEIGSILL